MRTVLIWCGVVVWIFMLFQFLLLLDVARIHPISNSVMINELTYCETQDCGQSRVIKLPFTSPERYFDGTETHRLQVVIPLKERPKDLQAIYVPKYSDQISIWLNNAQVYQAQPVRHLWNDPLLVEISPQLFQVGENLLELELKGVEPGRLDLRPFFTGDYTELRRAYQGRVLLGPGATRYIFGMVATLSLGCFLVWWNRPNDKPYLWLGLSCLGACFFLAMTGISFPMGGYKTWKIVQSTAFSAYVLFILKFLRTFLRARPTFVERAHTILLLPGVAAMLLSPVEHIFKVSLAMNLLTAFTGLAIVVLVVEKRPTLAPVDFAVFFFSLSLSLTLGFDGVLLNISNEPPRSMNLLHFMPLMTSLVCLWLILSQLIQSLTKQEALAESLQATVNQKTQQLEANYSKLADAQKTQAIHDERTRIMLELHDGVGGQLVSTLAYVDNNHLQDLTLKTALEDALRDLALMLDSIENQDDLPTLLGALRIRLDGLLEKNGVDLIWRIEDDFELLNDNPSDNLQVARVVQEAITNAIKHSAAKSITVMVNKNTILISDDGHGFETDPVENGETSKRGMLGMRARATSIGCSLKVVTGNGGTRVELKNRTSL